MLYLDKLGFDPEAIHLFPKNGETEGCVLLEVERPKFSPCPSLPNSLIGWIATKRWDDFRVEKIEVHEKLARELEGVGEVAVRFDAVAKRLDELESWKAERSLWRNGELGKQRTQDLFDDLYRIYERFRQSAEEIELVAGNGFFFSGLNPEVHHPLVLKRVCVQYDKRGIMQILDTDAPVEFYTDIFREQEGLDGSAIRDVQKKIEGLEIHPFSDDLKPVLEEMAPALTPKCRYAERGFQLLPTDWYILYGRPVFFLRKRNTGMEKLIEGIMEQVEAGAEVPLPLQELVGDASEGRAKETAEVTESLSDVRGESDDILLTKAANAEQLGIARKLMHSDAVVVQGPPGTGKTHTIANLLGHFLAQGNHVLVTSSTQKALWVLKDKLPQGIRNLCVALLQDSYQDMQSSVEGICEILARSSTEEMEDLAVQLKERRDSVRKKLAEARERLEKMQGMECKLDYFSYDGEEYSLSRMAQFLHGEKQLDGVIPGRVTNGIALPLSEEEFFWLYRSNAVLGKQDVKEMGEALPSSEQLISPERWEAFLAGKEVLKKRAKGLLQELPDWSVDENECLLYRNRSVVQEFNKEKFQELETFYSQLDFSWLSAVWAREAILAGRQGKGKRKVWEQLGEDIEKVQEIKERFIVGVLGRKVEIPKDILFNDKVLKNLSSMRDAFNENGKLPLWKKLRHRNWHLLQKIQIDGQEIASSEDCSLVECYIHFERARDKVRREWNQLLGSCGEPEYDELSEQGDDVEDLCSARWAQITFCLEWYKDYRSVFADKMMQAGLDVRLVLPKGEMFMTPRQRLDLDLAWLQTTWPAAEALLHLLYIEKQEGEEGNRSSIDLLKQGRSAIGKRLYGALLRRDLEGYREEYQRLLRYEENRSMFDERERLLKKLSGFAPEWAERIEQRVGAFGAEEPPKELRKAWQYCQFRQQLEMAEVDDVSKTEKDIERLTAELHAVTSELSEKLAWHHLLSELSGNGLQASLIGWSKSVKKVGKGTGKNASLHIREARKQMLEAQQAVPAWIMPLNKVWENLRPDSSKFDIIILDEASQADLTAIPLLYFGKKIIIVGDDKQVSPTAIGIADEELFRLRAGTIEGELKYTNLYTLDTSLYDLAQIHFERRMLKEHFRSVPEIIGFSNLLSYENEIQPLRESDSVLKPLVSCFVEGQREGSKKVNLQEAEMITSLLAACMQQPEYEGKTFGAITLLGDEQAKLIHDMAIRYLGVSALEERDFLCGNSANFQGDERDVIFLSLVDSAKGEETLRLMSFGRDDSTRKRYNVAVSRARDQIWVVHSVSLRNLKEGDLRYGLLSYVEHPEEYLQKDREISVLPMSPLSQSVSQSLRQCGYHVEERWMVGSCCIDIAVMSQGRRVAVVCDGESWDGTGSTAAENSKKQAVLERLGWKFFHVKGSEYYLDPSKAMVRLAKEFSRNDILPEGEEAGTISLSEQREELRERVFALAENLRKEWFS